MLANRTETLPHASWSYFHGKKDFKGRMNEVVRRLKQKIQRELMAGVPCLLAGAPEQSQKSEKLMNPNGPGEKVQLARQFWTTKLWSSSRGEKRILIEIFGAWD